MPKEKTSALTVTLSVTQLVTYRGKLLGLISVSGDHLVINRKVPRSSRFVNSFVHMRDVVAYSEGEGGKDGTAYAIVRERVRLSEISGEGVVDPDGVHLIDSAGISHVFTGSGLCDLSVTETTSEDDGVGDETAVDDEEHEEPRQRRPSREEPRQRQRRAAPREEPPARQASKQSDTRRSGKTGRARDELDF